MDAPLPSVNPTDSVGALGAGMAGWKASLASGAAALLVVVGIVLRLVPIADDPLHPDECLYATWALSVADGSDPLLRLADVDKPPVYPYLLAGWSLVVGSGPTALRLLGVTAAAVGLVALYRLAGRLCGHPAALAGLALASLSPVAVALDAGALTDPPAIAFALLAAAAAASGWSAVAGVCLGLAVGTKPQLLAYLPLVALLLPVPRRRSWWRAAGGLAAVVLAVALWEVARAAPSTFAAAAARNYGLLGWSVPGLSLAGDWLALLRWIWGEPWAIALWAGAVLCGAVTAWQRPAKGRGAAAGLGALLSLAAYVGGSLVFGMPAWDRYALAAVPLVALLLAWAAWALEGTLPRAARVPGTVLSLALVVLLWAPAREAATGRLPLGDTSHWEGIEDVASYVRGQVPGRATIAYRDLGWHVGYYLRHYPQDFVWVPDDASLVATARRAEPFYVLACSGEVGEAMLGALRLAGLSPEPAFTSYGHGGAAAMALYLVTRGE